MYGRVLLNLNRPKALINMLLSSLSVIYSIAIFPLLSMVPVAAAGLAVAGPSVNALSFMPSFFIFHCQRMKALFMSKLLVMRAIYLVMFSLWLLFAVPAPSATVYAALLQPVDAVPSASLSLMKTKSLRYSLPSPLASLVASSSYVMGPNPEETGSLTEGDIKEEPHGPQHRRRRSVTSYEYKRWPNGIIPYEFDASYSEFQRNLLRRAMDGIEEHTCVKFVERRGHEQDYVYVEARDGCSSYVGRRGGRQIVSLQAWTCLSKIGVMMHELMHVVGFYHEHTRLDRDEFIRIDWPNIQNGREVNFKQREQGSIDNQGLSYDYGSVMHYSAYAFSKDPRIPTLLPTQNSVPLDVLGQRDRLSTLDILKINTLYKCNTNTKIPQSQEEHQPPQVLHVLGKKSYPSLLATSSSSSNHGHHNNKYAPHSVHMVNNPSSHLVSTTALDPRLAQLRLLPYLSSKPVSKLLDVNYIPCADGFQPDAVIGVASGELLLVQNGNTWLIDANRRPRSAGKLQQHLPHSPQQIDGAFSWSVDTTFVFSNGHYWKYHKSALLNGYPQSIAAGFPGLPTSSLDAVFRWGKKVVFVKGERYWLLHPYVDSAIRGPFNLRNTTNIPMPIDIGFQESSTKATFIVVRGSVFKLQADSLQADLDSKQHLSDWLQCAAPAPSTAVSV